jgi:hypothetical protein
MSKWFLASTARESAGPDTTIRRFGLACEISLNPWRANLSYSLDVRAARDHFFSFSWRRVLHFQKEVSETRRRANRLDWHSSRPHFRRAKSTN